MLDQSAIPSWWILLPEKKRVGIKGLYIPPGIYQDFWEPLPSQIESVNLKKYTGIAMGESDAKTCALLKHNGFAYQYRLSGFPSIDAPRCLVSLSSPDASSLGFDLYTPQRWHGKAAKLMASVKLKAGQLFGLGQFLLVALREPPDLERQCESWTKSKIVGFNLTTGENGPFQKTTVQAAGKNGCALLYLKFSNKEKAEKRIKNEARILSTLNSRVSSQPHVPFLYFTGELNGQQILAQSALKGQKGSKFLTPLVFSFMEKLVDGTVAIMAGLPLWQEIKNRVLSYSSLAGFWPGIEKQLVQASIPLTVMHGDFAPWNTKVHGDKLKVFDWESARIKGLPFFDIFHYLLQYGFLVNRWSADKAIFKIQDLCKSRGFQSYMQKANLPPKIIDGLLELYLLFTLSTGEDPMEHPLNQERFALLRRVTGAKNTSLFWGPRII